MRKNMQRLKRTLRIAVAVLTAAVMVAIPNLQAYQLSHVGSSCSISCCCSCSCDQNSSPASESTTIEGSCCCRVSSPEPDAEIPFEAQPRPVSKSDTFAEPTCAASDNLLADTVSDQIFKIDIPLTHGPPLYVLNSSYLI